MPDNKKPSRKNAQMTKFLNPVLVVTFFFPQPQICTCRISHHSQAALYTFSDSFTIIRGPPKKKHIISSHPISPHTNPTPPCNAHSKQPSPIPFKTNTHTHTHTTCTQFSFLNKKVHPQIYILQNHAHLATRIPLLQPPFGAGGQTFSAGKSRTIFRQRRCAVFHRGDRNAEEVAQGCRGTRDTSGCSW